ncbi:MAG: DUF975 family protein, partial [Clostridiales bacterium]|nr:DUF975 family protein [Clostridiales bacterium]
FLGWFAVGVITAGIGFVWAIPYYDNAKVAFYKRELQGDEKAYRAQTEQSANALPPVNTADAVYADESVTAEESVGMQLYADRNAGESDGVAETTLYALAAEEDKPFVSDAVYEPTDAPLAENYGQAEQAYAVQKDTYGSESARVSAHRETENLRALQAELRRRRSVSPRASEQSDERALSRVSRRPLPGSRTVLDEMRGRVVAARRSQAESGQAPLPPRDSAAKQGESSLDRLRRLRDERAAKYGASTNKDNREDNT